jgi:hypothetical protein
MQRKVRKYRAFDTDMACHGSPYQEKKASVQLSLDHFYKEVDKIPSGSTSFQH